MVIAMICGGGLAPGSAARPCRPPAVDATRSRRLSGNDALGVDLSVSEPVARLDVVGHVVALGHHQYPDDGLVVDPTGDLGASAVGLPGPDQTFAIPDGPGLGGDPIPEMVDRFRLDG